MITHGLSAEKVGGRQVVIGAHAQRQNIPRLDLAKLNSDFATMADGLTELGQTMGVKIHTMHEDIFNCMHHI